MMRWIENRKISKLAEAYFSRNNRWLKLLGLYAILVVSSNSGPSLPIGVRLISGVVAAFILLKVCLRAARTSTISAAVVVGMIMATLTWLFYEYGIGALFLLPYPFGGGYIGEI
ncbi:hypothetical protein [Burkholderia cepacia]|uniref:hypothetical protein n=2 Tax=Burkholderia cepacia TaxID=292 RepID=UPI002AC3687A|nr:hypothetical protein [Burkholderia cepacia]